MDDIELVERAKNGQASAFAHLVRKYQDRVFNTCWRICGHYEDAKDVTQEAFIKAHQSLSGFRGDSSFYTWLFRVAVNLALSHRRSSARRRTVSLDAADDSTENQAEGLIRRMKDDSIDDPGRAVHSSESHSLVARALQSLDDDHRTVVVLRDIEGFDYQQIGHMLDIPTGTVKSRLARARMAMRAMLAPVLTKDG